MRPSTVGAVAADHEHGPVLALARVVLVGHPRPHHLARVGLAVELRRVDQRAAAHRLGRRDLRRLGRAGFVTRLGRRTALGGRWRLAASAWTGGCGAGRRPVRRPSERAIGAQEPLHAAHPTGVGRCPDTAPASARCPWPAYAGLMRATVLPGGGLAGPPGGPRGAGRRLARRPPGAPWPRGGPPGRGLPVHLLLVPAGPAAPLAPRAPAWCWPAPHPPSSAPTTSTPRTAPRSTPAAVLARRDASVRVDPRAAGPHGRPGGPPGLLRDA